jgi:hypothetical protein
MPKLSQENQEILVRGSRETLAKALEDREIIQMNKMQIEKCLE